MSLFGKKMGTADETNDTHLQQPLIQGKKGISYLE